MSPYLRAGDHVLVRYGGRVRAGDIALVALPERPLAVKRAIRPSAAGWWVQGDNPFASTDSRVLGPVPADAIVGRVVWRYWPVWRGRG